MKKRILAAVLAAVMVFSLAGCAGNKNEGKDSKKKSGKKTEIQVFIAASLNTVMTELAKEYQKEHPDVKITYNADSSGTLLTPIEEGYECDLFFSAAQKQMDQLEEDGLVVDGTRKNVVNNQVIVVTRKDSKTTEEVSKALGNVEISEQDNVSKVLSAVVEGSCEVGTTYYSDTYGYEKDLDILEKVSYDLTGDVIYPIAEVKNDEADKAQKAAAEDFLKFVTSDQSKKVFDSYYFDTNVK